VSSADRSRAPALTLVLLAPFLGEMLSGSTPALAFVLSPLVGAIEIALYGGGALLVRELGVRWRAGWLSILLLGLAYGLVEEGLVLKAVFDPAWPGAAALGTYGRAGQIGWVWLAQVDLFHATVSITAPIVLVGLMFPEHRGRPWLGRGWFVVLGIAWPAAVLAGAIVVRPEYAAQPQYLVVVLAVALLVALAHRTHRFEPRSPVPMRPIVAFIVGAVATWAFFVTTWSGPDAGRPAALTFALQLCIAGGTLWWLRHATRTGPLSDGARLALFAGVLSPFVALALPRVSDGGSVVAVATLAGVLILARRASRGEPRAITAGPI